EDGIRDFHVTGVQTCALPIFIRRKRELLLLRAGFDENLEESRFTGFVEDVDRLGEEGALVAIDQDATVGVLTPVSLKTLQKLVRSEERRVGKEWRCLWWT